MNDYNTFAKEWNATRRQPWGEFEFARELLTAKSILDAGCGNGRLVRWLRENGFEGKYLGADSSKELIKLAQQNFPKEKFEVHNLLEPLAQDENCDAVFCVAVLHHLHSAEERLKVLKNLHASLASSGRIFLTTWNLFQPRFWKQLLRLYLKEVLVMTFVRFLRLVLPLSG